MLTKIAKSDGVVSTKEASFISSMIDEFMEIYRDKNGTKREIINLRRELIERYKSTKDNNITIESYSYALAHHSHYQRVKVLQELVDIAYLDGLTREKEKMIYTVGDIFRFDKPQIYRYMTGYSNSEGEERDIYEYSYIKLDSYHILGVKRSDDLATIKRKYRKLVKEYHPDTLKGMGASENEILIA
jgi:DnaJ like chaperone protein